METFLQVITPEIAKAYLELNHSNRNLRKFVVQGYAKDIQAGRWHLTHQGIAFDQSGNLVDGQHRLNAIVLAGVPIEMMVTKGLEDSLHLDTHLKRSVADVLGINSHYVAVANFFLRRSQHLGRPSIEEVEKFVDDHLEGLEFSISNLNFTRKGVGSCPVKAAVLSAYYSEDLDRLTRFCKVLGTGLIEDSSERSAIVLRDFLTTRRLNRTDAVELFHRTERAIRRFIKGDDVKFTRSSDEDFYKLP